MQKKLFETPLSLNIFPSVLVATIVFIFLKTPLLVFILLLLGLISDRILFIGILKSKKIGPLRYLAAWLLLYILLASSILYVLGAIFICGFNIQACSGFTLR